MMGGLCCCLRDELEDYANPRNFLCVRCFLHNLLFMYASLFRRGEEYARLTSPSFQRTSSFGSSISLDSYRSPPRPLPYDADPRYLRLQREGLVSRREKGSCHLTEESEPLRCDNDVGIDNSCVGNKNNYYTEDGAKESHSMSSLKLSNTKEMTGFAHINASSEDEDVCPTCLEEYTIENPKIITKCSHHFHLVCIYEWMERSETCPVCGKVMAFDETA